MPALACPRTILVGQGGVSRSTATTFSAEIRRKSDEPSSGQSLFCFFEKTENRQPKRVISFENTSESSHFDSLPEDNVFSQSRQNAVPAEESATGDASDDRCGSQVCTVFLESIRCFSNRSFQSRDAEPPSMSAKRRLLSSSRTHEDAPSGPPYHQYYISYVSFNGNGKRNTVSPVLNTCAGRGGKLPNM